MQKICQKIIFILTLLPIGLYIGLNAYAFGHPDRTIPDMYFLDPPDSPLEGYSFNPVFYEHPVASFSPDYYSQTAATPGFFVKFTAEDPPAIGAEVDEGGGISSCKFATRSIDLNKEDDLANTWSHWNNIADCPLNKTQTAKVLVTSDYCPGEKQGTNVCGVRVEVCDNKGCVQEERFFSIDITPPSAIEISSNRSDPTNQRDATFTFWATDEYGISGFKCKLNNGNFAECTSPKAYAAGSIPEGINTFTVKAFDIAGNSATSSLTWEVDSIAPSQITGTAVTHSQSGAIRFSSNPFFANLQWKAPTETGIRGTRVTQYDIRYIRHDETFYGHDAGAPQITDNTLWEQASAVILKEPFPPQIPGSLEELFIGPPDNPLSPATSYSFGIRSRDELWNWSNITAFPVFVTPRDPCDYDADRVHTANTACQDQPGSSTACKSGSEACDLYDNPYEWGLPETAVESQAYIFGASGNWGYTKPETNDFWLQNFGSTLNDLDRDGSAVATGRRGRKVAPAPLADISDRPTLYGNDWYDNPFTADLYNPNTGLDTGLSSLPTLKQLADTINDLDLDTFALKSWSDTFGFVQKIEPENADLRIVANSAEGGCVYPEALEATCFNCTAFRPEISTGRVPPQKTIAYANKNRAVCQIEAFYKKLENSDPPYAIISTGTIKDNADPHETVITSSAQCGDGVDNNLNGKLDYSKDPKDLTREQTCQTTFQKTSLQKEQNIKTAGIFDAQGIVKCGRNADDFKTRLDESAPCELKHFFYLFREIIELILYPLMPLFVALSFVAGGFLMVISRGRAQQFSKAKDLMKWALIVYFGVLIFWVVLSTFFSLVGVMKWTGLIPVRGSVTALAVDTAATPGYVEDSTKNWVSNEWQGFLVEIEPLNGAPTIVRRISSNTPVRLTIDGTQPFDTVGIKYHIVGTGWWSFIGETTKEPVADFSANPPAGIAPFTVDFVDLSAGEIESWRWNFGDGGTSADQSPTHNYLSNPPFPVSLTVSGTGGENTSTKTVFHAPTANFTASILRGRAPLTVAFNNASQGNVESLRWNFSDPQSDYLNISSEQSPTHIFNTPGPYLVTLSAIGPVSKNSQTKLNYIFVHPQIPTPLANFQGSPIENTTSAWLENLSLREAPGAQTSPTDYMSGWNWDMDGDGTFGESFVEYPVFFYATRSTAYLPALIAKGPNVQSPPKIVDTPVAFPAQAHFAASADRPQSAGNFAVVPNGILPKNGPRNIPFADSSTGTASGWRWDFNGDGVYETGDTNPTPIFGYEQNGRYDVKLKALSPEQASGQADQSKIDKYIAIAPYADFVFQSAVLSDGPRSNGTVSPPQPPSTGPQPAACTTEGDGCTVGESGVGITFSTTGTRCPSGACNTLWQYGDGQTQLVAGLGAGTNVYQNNGDYPVRMTVNGVGGSDIEEKFGYIHVAPWAEFSPKTRQSIERGQCQAPVSFSNESRVNIPDDGWSWDFEGGSPPITIQNPGTVNFVASNSPGRACFDVTLTTKGPGGKDIETKQDLVTFLPIADVSPDNPRFDTSITIREHCDGTRDPIQPYCPPAVTISDVSTGESCIPHTDTWSAGNSLKACSTDTPVKVSTTLTVSNSCAETSQATATLIVYQSVKVEKDDCPPPAAAAVRTAMPLDLILSSHLKSIKNWLNEFVWGIPAVDAQEEGEEAANEDLDPFNTDDEDDDNRDSSGGSDGSNPVNFNNPNYKTCALNFDIDKDLQISPNCPQCSSGIVCDDYYDRPEDIHSSLTNLDANAYDHTGTQKTIREILFATRNNLDQDAFVDPIAPNGNDYYANPYAFTRNITASDTPWLQLFNLAGKGDLDRDGVDVKVRTGLPQAPDPNGTDWYDNPFTPDTAGVTLVQLRQTLNDLDLDGYARLDSGASPSENLEFDKNGCINPSALEGATCPPGKICTVASKDPITGRVPIDAFNTGAPGPVAPHPWDVCQEKAYYGCGLFEKTITSGAPPNPDTGGAGNLLLSTYQCSDGIDNNLNGKIDSQEPACDIARDLDGDGVVAATNTDCIDPTNCDFYDDPNNFGTNLRGAHPAGESTCWMEIFRTTANDLDGDGLPVARSRIGQLQNIAFSQNPPDNWQDWYDNPFSFTIKPTLTQLAHTKNDMDLDTFISEEWGREFIDNTKSWRQMPNWEPDNADRNSCVYPSSVGPPYLEGTCANCRAETKDQSTGRLPAGKNFAALPLNLNPPLVCQTEAYYTDQADQNPPLIRIASGLPDPLRTLTTLTSQCTDGIDNDLNGLTDGVGGARDMKCPALASPSGLVPCGLWADDVHTPIDESQPCSFCHFFYLFHRIINGFVWWITPIAATLFLAYGGFLFATSAVSPDRIVLAKKVLVMTVSGYVVVLISWMVVNTFLTKLGVTSWTGFTAEESIVSSAVDSQLCVNTASWNSDQWKNIAISITKSANPELVGQVRIAENNTSNCLTLKNSFTAVPQAGDEFKIGGWWQFVCE